jgi:hypothetical protein
MPLRNRETGLLFHWGRRAAIDERANKIARMVMFICNGLRTKNYNEFVASFSNPWKQPDASERQGRQFCFQMRISDTCWYDAVADYPSERTDAPQFYIVGGGDDWGVIISGHARADHRIRVDLHVPSGSNAGRDARAMVRALQAISSWSRVSDLERALGLID